MDSPFCLYQQPTLRVPLINGPFRYDGPSASLPFAEFPSRIGFCGTSNVIDQALLSMKSNDEVASLLQAWLFFGLLSEFTMEQDLSQYFASQSAPADRRQGVSFQHLPSMISKLRARVARLPFSERASWRTNLTECLHIADISVVVFDSMEPKTLESTVPSAILSIRLLLEFVKQVSTLMEYPPPGFWARHVTHSKFFSNRWLFQYGLSTSAYKEWLSGSKRQGASLRGGDKLCLSERLLLQCFENHQWCPSQARRVLDLYELPTVNYFASMPRKSVQGIEHSACRGAPKCIAHNVSLTTTSQTPMSPQQSSDAAAPLPYVTHHLTTGCDCVEVRINTSEVMKIVERGGIPLVSMKFGSAELKIVDARPWT